MYEKTKSARKILIVDLGFLGDSVHLVPALREIKRNYPEATLDVITSPVGCQVIRMADCVNRATEVEMNREKRSLLQQFQVLAAARRQRYDLAFNFTAAERPLFFLAFSGAKYRVTSVAGRLHFWKRWLGLNWMNGGRIPMPGFQRRRQMLASCGLALGAATFDLKPPADAKAWAGENIQPGAIHFALCASTSMREWPVAHWTELADRIWKRDPSTQIIATAGYNDRERAVLKAFASRLTNQNLRTFGRLTIPQLTAAMQRCALHVGSDSGPLHLARACDLPTVSFFRTYQGIEGWLPRGEMHSTFVAPCDCTSGQHRPCEKTGTPRCLNAIKVDEVFAAVRNLRGGGSAII